MNGHSATSIRRYMPGRPGGYMKSIASEAATATGPFLKWFSTV